MHKHALCDKELAKSGDDTRLIHMHAYSHICMHTRHTYTRTHQHLETNTHTHTHMYTRAYSRVYIPQVHTNPSSEMIIFQHNTLIFPHDSSPAQKTYFHAWFQSNTKDLFSYMIPIKHKRLISFMIPIKHKRLIFPHESSPTQKTYFHT